MLINFSVTNFRSFHDTQSCTFLASSDDAHEHTHCIDTGLKGLPRLLKSAVIFGANASGKSNLLMALRAMRELVISSTALSATEFAARYMPFRLDRSADQPTVFEMEVLLEGVRYQYTFSYDARRIRHEQLLVYHKRKSQRWFTRQFDASGQEEYWAPFSASLSGPREMWRKATRPTALFLTTAGKLNSEQFQPLLHWFEHRLEVLLSADAGDPGNLPLQLRNPRSKDRVLKVLKALDVHVDDIRVTETPAANAAPGGATFIRNAARPKIELLHSSREASPMWLELRHESAGVQRLVMLLGPLLEAMEKGKMTAIDEFDTHLHPLAARFLVQLVNDPGIAATGAQLLLSTHDTALMDLNLLRRDEIWLMDLDPEHASSLSAMGQHSARKHEKVAKSYLSGRYGAVPDIDRENQFAIAERPLWQARAKEPAS